MSELHAILEVQRLDNSLDQLRYRHENLAERDQIATADTELAALTDATKNTEASRDDLRRRQSGLETDAADFEEKANGLDVRLYGGMVTSPKEATAITVEIESLRARQSGLEDQSIELLVEIEPLDEMMVQAEAARGEIEARRTAASNALSEAVTNLDDEIEAQLSARESATAEVGEKLLELYRRMRITYGPDAVVEFDAGRDGGCPVSMSAVELDRWKHLPVGTLEPCVDCGRLVAKIA